MRGFLSTALLLGITSTLNAQAAGPGNWPAYGRDRGGERYAPLTGITRETVGRLAVAWEYSSGEASVALQHPVSFEATPLVLDGTMYLLTPLGKVIALEAETGAERWVHDLKVPLIGFGDFTSRGVALWRDPSARSGAPCALRVIAATVDARLFALDAGSGAPCADFGAGGSVDLRAGLRNAPDWDSEYEETSPPAIVNGLVVVGSGVADNSRTDAASGEVRAYDARSGALRWSWDPVPQDPHDPGWKTWIGPAAHRTGAANAWPPIMTDSALGLVFVPTSSASPDYFGGERLGQNLYANSIVALHASTGKMAWHFQTVHHDLWDYDNASPPALTTIVRNGRRVPVVLQATKTGMLFVLDRATGRPVFPVQERPVPRSDIAGEQAWPTQPLGIVLSPANTRRYSADDAWGPTPADRAACRDRLAPLRNDGPFTPPSLEGTLQVPSNIGGAQWGGVAVDPERQIAVVPVNRIAAAVQLIPREEYVRRRGETGYRMRGSQYTDMRGTPFVLRRELLFGPSGAPCTAPPFGSLVAVDLRTGTLKWDVPLGSMLPEATGSPNLGGPIITAGGLVFVAATLDRRLHAYDIDTGSELWSAPLPAGGKATPMTFQGASGRQYVVIAAGGDGDHFGRSDRVVAFALPADSAPPLPPPGRLVDIGGWRLHLNCTGDPGPGPTVVLEAGAGDFSVEWSLVQPGVAKFARVCSYDRGGDGWSDLGPHPRTMHQIVYELHTLLERAGEHPPYVLAGHSYGAWLVRFYQMTYPADVAGLVLVEGGADDPLRMLPNGKLVHGSELPAGQPLPPVQTSHPLRESEIPPAALSQIKSGLAEASLHANDPPRDRLPVAARQMRTWALGQVKHVAAAVNPVESEELAMLRAQHAANPHPLGELPLVVLARGLPEESGPQGALVEREHRADQTALATLSTKGRLVVAEHSGHHIQLQQPELVVSAIREVVAAAPAPGPYRITHTYLLGGEGSWDYVVPDPPNHRLFIGRQNRVMVVDADDGKLLGEVSGINGAHGVALTPKSGHGFATAGNDGMVVMFDPGSFQVLGRIPAAEDADALIYDPASDRVFTFNGDAHSATVVDPRGTLVSNIPLGGKPESGATAGNGKAYVNLVENAEVVELDTKAMTVTRRWPTAPCGQPVAMAIDTLHHRLFSGCRSGVLAVSDYQAGKVVATAPIGSGVNGTAFDPASGDIFASCVDGTLTVIHQDDADHYHVVQTLATAPGGRNMGLDPTTHRVYVVAAKFGPAPAEATPGNPRRRPPVLPGTFSLMVVERTP